METTPDGRRHRTTTYDNVLDIWLFGWHTGYVMDVQDRYVVVEAHALADFLNLGLLAADAIGRVSSNDPLVSALRGGAAQLQGSIVSEP